MNIFSSITSFAKGFADDVIKGSGIQISKDPDTNKKVVSVDWNTTLPIVAAPLASVSATSNVVSKLLTPVKKVASMATEAFKSLKPMTKLTVTAASVPVAMTVAKSSTLQKAIINTPSAVNKLTSNTASFIDDPSWQQAKKTFVDNPALVSVLGLSSVAALGYGTSGLISSALNTSAMRSNTAAQLASSSGNIPSALTTDPLTPETNRFDARINEKQTESALDVAKEQTEQLKLQLANDLAIAKLQAIPATVTPTAVATTPITTKKKTTKKKTTKKKATKKKKAKKKATKKKTKKKTKTIKRKKKK